jgi:hypothetical protein
LLPGHPFPAEARRERERPQNDDLSTPPTRVTDLLRCSQADFQRQRYLQRSLADNLPLKFGKNKASYVARLSGDRPLTPMFALVAGREARILAS